tara:strand:+ start:1007 stop:1774 length:768 start_codon:yes stop_codon:yes gene_type:complete
MINLQEILIWLDPAHGGHDSGALSPSGLKESDVSLVVCQMAKSKLEALGLRVMMSRHDDVFVPLWERASMANDAGAAVFVSPHLNAAKKPASGIETFAFPGSEDGDRLAQALQDELLDASPDSPDRGVKYRKFSVLEKTKMPAALVELEFMHTPEGDAYFRDQAILERCAEALVVGICKFIGMKVDVPDYAGDAGGVQDDGDPQKDSLEMKMDHLRKVNVGLAEANAQLVKSMRLLSAECKVAKQKIIKARKALA